MGGDPARGVDEDGVLKYPISLASEEGAVVLEMTIQRHERRTAGATRNIPSPETELNSLRFLGNEIKKGGFDRSSQGLL